jgi:hypothetical protein
VNSIADYVDTLQPALETLPMGNDCINVLIKQTNQYFETVYVVSATNDFINNMKKHGIKCHFERKE